MGWYLFGMIITFCFWIGVIGLIFFGVISTFLYTWAFDLDKNDILEKILNPLDKTIDYLDLEGYMDNVGPGPTLVILILGCFVWPLEVIVLLLLIIGGCIRVSIKKRKEKDDKKSSKTDNGHSK
jgi:hypothetical protein